MNAPPAPPAPNVLSQQQMQALVLAIAHRFIGAAGGKVSIRLTDVPPLFPDGTVQVAAMEPPKRSALVAAPASVLDRLPPAPAGDGKR